MLVLGLSLPQLKQKRGLVCLSLGLTAQLSSMTTKNPIEWKLLTGKYYLFCRGYECGCLEYCCEDGWEWIQKANTTICKKLLEKIAEKIGELSNDN